MPWLHEREHYRVAYPQQLRPKFMVQGFTFDVVDVCERGLRFQLAAAGPPEPGFEVAGTLRFRRGETVAVRGTVLRVVEGQVAVRLDDRVPLRVIMDEQRFLLDRNRHMGM